ncbi:hypothetical protein KY330_05165 [Candidatus Woesearchaeota archaeon]|nr:hypothetical protein [Candidatus Woesearchaeota archaeon]
MNKIILFGLLTLILVVGCQTQAFKLEDTEEPLTVSVISFTTDRELYHSNEVIRMASSISSNRELENVTVRFYGIMASRNRIDESIVRPLVVGENTLEVEYQAPSCYGCAGVRPGTYQITCEVLNSGELAATRTIDIELRQ